MSAKNTRIFRKTSKHTQNHENQGFTLLESLVGILVITTVAVTITPPIVLSTATRVQNRRAEQAMQIAQGEVDRIRVFVEQGTYTNSTLPPFATGTVTNIAAVSAPTEVVDTRALANATSKAFKVDVDKDNNTDFYVQIFRDNNSKAIVTGATSTIVAFQMGVRVYSKVAKFGRLQTQPASLRLTTNSGNQEIRPLAVVYTTITRSDAKISLEKYKDYLSP